MKAISGLLVLVCVLAISACGKKDGDSNSEDKVVTGFSVSDAIAFPADADAGLVDLKTVPAGEYKLARIRSYGLGLEGKAKAAFDHTSKILGSPKRGDAFKIKASWGDIDKSKQVAQVTVSINLPLMINATGSAAEFKDKRSYYHYVRSDESWAWSLTNGESPEGSQFHLLFSAGRKTGNATYVLDGADATFTGKATAKVNGGELQVYAEIKNGADTAVIELTYRK